MLNEIVAEGFDNPRTVLSVALTATALFAFYRRWKASRELKLPFLKFEDGDDSRQRYVAESGKLLKLGYEKVRNKIMRTIKNAHKNLQPKEQVLIILNCVILPKIVFETWQSIRDAKLHR